MRKSIYIAIENNWPGVGNQYPTSRQIISKLNELYDVHLVKGDDFDLDSNTFSNSYKLNSNMSLIHNKSRHIPFADLFIIYGLNGRSGDNSFNGVTKTFDFLERLEQNNQFSQFMNSLKAQRQTLKDALVDLSQKFEIITPTFQPQTQTELKKLLESGEKIQKEVCSCGGLGVKKVNLEDLSQIPSEFNYRDVVYQHLLPVGLETRIVIPQNPNDAFGRAYIGNFLNLETGEQKISQTVKYIPSKDEVEQLDEIRKHIDADIISLDGMGLGNGEYVSETPIQKLVNENESILNHKLKGIEINGTGTGMKVFEKKTGQILYDKTNKFIEIVRGKLNG